MIGSLFLWPGLREFQVQDLRGPPEKSFANNPLTSPQAEAGDRAVSPVSLDAPVGVLSAAAGEAAYRASTRMLIPFVL